MVLELSHDQETAQVIKPVGMEDSPGAVNITLLSPEEASKLYEYLADRGQRFVIFNRYTMDKERSFLIFKNDND
jgi:hypothetical protein